MSCVGGKVRRWTAGVVVVLGLTACSDGTDSPRTEPSPGPTTTSPGSSPTPTVLADPPLAFAEENVRIGWRSDAMALRAGAAYAYSGDGLGAAELATGEELWHRSFEQSSAPVNATAPVVVDLDGRAVVFAAYFAQIPGDGSRAATRLIRVAAVNAEDGTPVWTTDVAADEQIPSDVSYPAISAADQRYVVMTTENQGDVALTVVLDAVTGAELWRNDRFRARDLDGGTVVGVEPIGSSIVDFRAAGYSAADGRPVWTGPAVTSPVASDAGPGLALLHGDTPDGIDPVTYLLDVRTGRPAVTLPAHYACEHDGAQTVVCVALAVGQQGDLVVGYDLRSHAALWSLPSDGRPAPEVTDVYGALVYGKGTDGPVVLDARSGTVRRSEVAIAPTLVTAGYGLVEEGMFTLVHPATG